MGGVIIPHEFHFLVLYINSADMEKGVDTPTLSGEIVENCGNFWIAED